MTIQNKGIYRIFTLGGTRLTARLPANPKAHCCRSFSGSFSLAAKLAAKLAAEFLLRPLPAPEQVLSAGQRQQNATLRGKRGCRMKRVGRDREKAMLTKFAETAESVNIALPCRPEIHDGEMAMTRRQTAAKQQRSSGDNVRKILPYSTKKHPSFFKNDVL